MYAGYTGEKILALRKERGWTQKELAEKLHVTDKAVSKWERGMNYPDLMLMEPPAAGADFGYDRLIGNAVYLLRKYRQL